MDCRSETEVLIVGAGPVGLTLALDLAQRGIDVVVVERRGARRAAPDQDQSHFGTIHGDIPAPWHRQGAAGGWAATELSQRCCHPHDGDRDRTGANSDSIAEPIAIPRSTGPTVGGQRPNRPTGSIKCISSLFYSRMRSPNRAFESFLRRASRISCSMKMRLLCPSALRIRMAPFQLSCRYLVGCDGGQSMVRKKIGATAQRNPNHPPGPIHLHPRARTSVPHSWSSGLVFSGPKSASLRNRLRDRWPRHLAGALLSRR